MIKLELECLYAEYFDKKKFNSIGLDTSKRSKKTAQL